MSGDWNVLTEKEMVARAPYVASWSGEEELPARVVEKPGIGVGFADESVWDRDRRGVLWVRQVVRPGVGRPLFGKLHSVRQRRAMLRLLCSVCGGPADVTDDGVLWLLADRRNDWVGWPEDAVVDEAPICLSCVGVSVRLCPALRERAVAVRARFYPVVGVRGGLYACDRRSVVSAGSLPRPRDVVTVMFGEPAIRYVVADTQVRQLAGTSLLEVDELLAVTSCRS